MATPPDFVAGQVLTAAQMNAVGLWEIRTETFSAVTTINFPNDTFTSDFDNYRLVATFTGSNSGNQGVSLRMRAAGVTNTSSNYNYRRHGIVGGANFVDAPATTTGFNNINGANPMEQCSIAIDILGPKLVEKTMVDGLTLSLQSTDLFILHYGGQMTVTTSYDSFQIESNGNITGTARLYGYRN
jgi:hypothetical protein